MLNSESSEVGTWLNVLEFLPEEVAIGNDSGVGQLARLFENDPAVDQFVVKGAHHRDRLCRQRHDILRAAYDAEMLEVLDSLRVTRDRLLRRLVGRWNEPDLLVRQIDRDVE